MKIASRTVAETLRQGGMSIKEIARKVEVSQSTASRWCAGITLSSEQRTRLERNQREAGAKALAPWIERNRVLKQKDLAKQSLDGRRDVGTLSKRDLLILGLGLYWGEGYKRGSQEWGFTNSEPGMICAILAWLLQSYGVTTDRIIARLTINDRYKTEAKRITRIWAKETGIPLSQFGSPTFIHGYAESSLQARTYRGTLRIKVRRGTSLRRRILASIAELETQITPNSRKTAS